MKLEITPAEGATHYRVDRNEDTGEVVITWHKIAETEDSFIVRTWTGEGGWVTGLVHRKFLGLNAALFLKLFREVKGE